MCESCGCTPCKTCGAPIEDGVCSGCWEPANQCVCEPEVQLEDEEEIEEDEEEEEEEEEEDEEEEDEEDYN